MVETDLVPVKQDEAILTPEIPAQWDFDRSIEKIQPLIYRWKNLTVEIAKELWIAREKLSKEGNPHISLTGTNVPVKQTWAGYCEAIGLEKRTANRWLASIFGNVRLPPPELPKLESQVIYADPPWAFNNSGLDQSAANKYPVLTIDEICNYKDESGKSIKQLAKERQSVLFLWTSEALIPEALQVLTAWGFVYKAQMIWIKDRAPGMGWWVNSKHEVLFLGSKGDALHPAIKYDSYFNAPVTEHSKKPSLVYERIEAMYSGPYIELFARNTREGWISWGNQVK